MTSKPTLSSVDRIYPLFVQKFTSFTPISESANPTDRLNAMVQYLNSLGMLSNDVVNDWNKVMGWVMNEGLDVAVDEKVTSLVADGTLDSLINPIIEQITSIAQEQIDLINQNQVVLKSEYETFEGTTNEKINDLKVLSDSLLPDSTINATTTLSFNVPSKVVGDKKNKRLNTSTNLVGDVAINSSDLEISGLNTEGNSTHGVYFQGSLLERISMVNSIIKTNGIGFQINTIGNKDLLFAFNRIRAGSYGFLLNSNSLDGSHLNLLFNDIYSERTDAIEINLPSSETDATRIFKGVKIIGNTVEADEGSTATTGGFGIGLAKVKNGLIANNYVKHSRRDGYHLEDDQENVLSVNGIYDDCVGDGAVLLNKANAKPTIFSHNQLKKKGLVKTGYGIWRVNDVNGSLDVSMIGNVIRGFDRGYFIDGTSYANVEGSLVEDCNYAISISSSGKVTGNLHANRCTTLLRGGDRVVMDKIISKSKPTTIIEYVGVAGGIGATLKGFEIPTDSFTPVAAVSQNLDLFKLPNHLNGRIIVRCQGFQIHAKVFYDDTTLTVSEVWTDVSGVFDSVSLIQNGTNLAVRFYAASAQVIIARTIFDGIYYVNI